MVAVKDAMKYSILCPQCGREHIFATDYVDNVINCECGFECYAFALGDFRIMMPGMKAENKEVIRSMRRFVVSTGRGSEISPELYIEEGDCLERIPDMYAVDYDLETEFEWVLEEYQTAAFGECVLNKDQLDSVCESLSGGKDVELKRKKDGVEIIELKKKKVRMSSGKRVRSGEHFPAFRHGRLAASCYLQFYPDDMMRTEVSSSKMPEN